MNNQNSVNNSAGACGVVASNSRSSISGASGSTLPRRSASTYESAHVVWEGSPAGSIHGMHQMCVPTAVRANAATISGNKTDDGSPLMRGNQNDTENRS